MNHPIFRNKVFLLIYLVLWLGIILAHTLFVFFSYKISFQAVITDSITFNILFLLFGFSLWFPVRYHNSKSSIASRIAQFFITAIVVLIIWFALSFILCRVLNPNNKEYLLFLAKSIPWRFLFGMCFYSILILVYYLFIYYDNLSEQTNTEIRLRETIKEAELTLLKSQINPHFLFNSLNSVSSLTITDPEKAHEMIIKLSDYLRYSISFAKNEMISLKQELENIVRYLDIEKTRFGSRLEYHINIEDKCIEAKLPAMILQPLYENTIKHGVYESTEPIIVKTDIHSINNGIQIILSNNFDPNAKPAKGSGIGLRNIHERLRIIYHNDQLLQTRIHLGHIFEVQLNIPLNESK